MLRDVVEESDTRLAWHRPIPLDDDMARVPDCVGVKAANLAQLITAGFPVPEGVALPVTMFEAFRSLNGFGSDPDSTDVALAKIADDIRAELARIAKLFGDVPLAVRSSAIAEDLPDASYAGLYDSVLDVRGADQLVDAVRQCWVSVYHERIATYRRARGMSDVMPIGVIIQRLVDADAAGVAFTMNPVTGARNETIVNAVSGLGERLVAGMATPDEWVINDGVATEVRDIEGSITADQALAIAKLARKVEAHFGAPQDIEWAIDGEDLYLLQARPVTTVAEITPRPVSFTVPDGFWLRDSEHFPRPLSPMCRSYYPASMTRVVSQAFHEFGFLVDGLEYRDIGGSLYARIVPPGGGSDGPSPPWWLLGILVRVHPTLRGMIRRAREAERTRLGDRLLDRWDNEWRDELQSHIRELSRAELTTLSDAELLDEIHERVTFFEESNHLHFRLWIPYGLALADLVFFCRDHLGWDVRLIMELLGGVSDASTEPARKLASLADVARQRPAVVEALMSGYADSLDQLHAVDPEFGAMLNAYQQEFGCRALGEDIKEPTLGERPEITLNSLRGQLHQAFSAESVSETLAERRRAVANQARVTLADRPELCATFNRILAQAIRAYPVREENSFLTYQAPGGLLRLALLDLGRRLVDRAQLDEPEDVMFLEMPEARQALQRGNDCRDLVIQRKGEYAWGLSNPGPESYGTDPGPPPDLRAVPREARRLMDAVSWLMESEFPLQHDEAEGIRGSAASPGVYTGPVRIIRSEAEFHKLQPGDVLVCPITSPVWSVLFGQAGALVTDVGGVLSHSAIIAREHAIPAIVGTTSATQQLTDGQLVQVDGTTGTVEVLS